jgi:GTP-binding protein Era
MSDPRSAEAGPGGAANGSAPAAQPGAASAGVPAGHDARAVRRCGLVAVVGRPNVGKSTLVNRLVGARVSITSRKAQTTRQPVRGIVNTADAQLVLVDTPGFQTRHRSALHRRMNRALTESLDGVDVVVVVVEALRLTDEDRAVIARVPRERPVIVAINKVDRVADKSRLLPFLATLAGLREFAALVPVSAERGTQLEDLVASIAKELPEAPALYGPDEITDRDERFLAAELVREKVFRQLGDEVPYASAVVVERFEQEAKLRRIRATIYVERASQRAILLGEGGERIKRIGTDARRDMESLFGGKVFLELWVKVKEGWADDEATLGRFGFE